MVCPYLCSSCPFGDCTFDGVTEQERAAQDKFDSELQPVEPTLLRRRESNRRYNHSNKGKESRKRYSNTDKGREVQKRYNQSEKRREQWRIQNAKRKERNLKQLVG